MEILYIIMHLEKLGSAMRCMYYARMFPEHLLKKLLTVSEFTASPISTHITFKKCLRILVYIPV